MSQSTSIEWTEATWNPIRGCTKISAGCKHCYAEVFAERWRGVPGHPYEQGFDLRLVPEKLLEPLSWRRPRKVFVNSMSDLFHPGVDVGFLRAILEVMGIADWHTYQVLTKRADRMNRLLAGKHPDLSTKKHIWLGVSVENRAHGVPRIRWLQETSAAVRFLSIEPLLEDLGSLDLTGIDWVIVGGESGPRSRRLQESWVTSIRDQCREVRVPFFFKQWGGFRKSQNGRELEGRTYDEYPSIRPPAAPSSEERARRQRRAEVALHEVA